MTRDEERTREILNQIHVGTTVWDQIHRDNSCSQHSVSAHPGRYGKPWAPGEFTGGVGVHLESGEVAAWLFAMRHHNHTCDWQLCDPGKAKTLKGIHRAGRVVLYGQVRFSFSQAGSDIMNLYAVTRQVTPALGPFLLVMGKNDPGGRFTDVVSPASIQES